MTSASLPADPALLSLTELAAAIRDRKLSSVEATQACLTRIAAWQPHTNAFVTHRDGRGRGARRAARRGRPVVQ